MAFDMSSGRLLWSKQMTAADDWNTSCRLPDQINCTNRDAPDHDFASPPILVRLPNGRRAIVSGQKSGVVHALDPDRNGELIWQERVGKGGINGGVQWGSAADQSTMYVALSDIARTPVPNSQATIPDPSTGGGMFALRLDSGQRVWHTPRRRRAVAATGAVRRSRPRSARCPASRSPAPSMATSARSLQRTARSSGTSIR